MSTDLAARTIDDGWETEAEDASSRMLQGQLLKFSDGSWTYGQNATIMSETTRLVAFSVAAAWVQWDQGKPINYLVRKPGEQWIDRAELGLRDETTWEKMPDGKARDPWQKTKFVYLVDPITAESYTYSTSSASGFGAVEDLAGQIHRKRYSGRKVLPLIELRTAPMKTKFGMKRKPVLKVVDWVNADGSPQQPSGPAPKQIEHRAPVQRDMDDDIPF